MNNRDKKMNNRKNITTESTMKPSFSNVKNLEFLTPTVMRVLDFFLTDPLKEYYGREVSRQTGVSTGSANKILRLLTEINFLSKEKKGNIITYKLNWEEPAVRQFKVLLNVFALSGLVNQLNHVSRKIVLFGSSAQGTDAKDSDIDLFVLTSDKESARKAISNFQNLEKRQLAPIIVEANEFMQLKKEDKPLYENIEKGIVLWQAE